jgi:hypothetical protein
MIEYGVHNWNASSWQPVTLVALDILAMRGRPQPRFQRATARLHARNSERQRDLIAIPTVHELVCRKWPRRLRV